MPREDDGDSGTRSERPKTTATRLRMEEEEEDEDIMATSTSHEFDEPFSSSSSSSSSSQTRPSQSPRPSQVSQASQRTIPAEGDGGELHPDVRRGARPEFEGDVNPRTGEVGGPKNEPLRWGGGGEWSYNGRATDF